jgi:hypothetical protein
MIRMKNVREDEVGNLEDRKLLSEELRRKRRYDIFSIRHFPYPKLSPLPPNLSIVYPL